MNVSTAPARAPHTVTRHALATATIVLTFLGLSVGTAHADATPSPSASPTVTSSPTPSVTPSPAAPAEDITFVSATAVIACGTITYHIDYAAGGVAPVVLRVEDYPGGDQPYLDGLAEFSIVPGGHADVTYTMNEADTRPAGPDTVLLASPYSFTNPVVRHDEVTACRQPVVPSTPAASVTPVKSTPVKVKPVVKVAPVKVKPVVVVQAVPTVAVARVAAPQLASTGTDHTVGLVGFGLVLLAAGFGLVWGGRRARSVR